MQGIRHWLPALAAAGSTMLFASACVMPAGHNANAERVTPPEARPPPGSNQILRAPIQMAEGVEVIISDVVIPPNGQVPRHFHPGEEFLYVIEGSAVHIEEGQPDRLLRAGDAYVIPPRAAHSPQGGPQGARAIVFRVHEQGEPERTLLEN